LPPAHKLPTSSRFFIGIFPAAWAGKANRKIKLLSYHRPFLFFLLQQLQRPVLPMADPSGGQALYGKTSEYSDI
jgi:hypothetical protein